MKTRFQNRIARYNTMAAALTTAAAFVAIYFVVRTTAYNHLDSDIVAEGEEVLEGLVTVGDSIRVDGVEEWEELEHGKIEVNPTFLQIVDLKGRVVFHSQNLLSDQILYDPGNESGHYFNAEIGGQRVRQGQFPVRNAAGQICGQLTVAISQQESYVILNNLMLVLLIAYPLVLGVQFVASQIAAARAIAPVQKLRKTAAGIAATSLGTRLELPRREDELHDLTQTINGLLDRLENAMLQQKQFTSDASHEIRTPLAAIRGTLEVLLRKPRPAAQYEAKLAGLLAEVDRIDRLLEQLLQLARLERGAQRYRMEPLDLEKWLPTRLEQWEAGASEAGITLQCEVAGPAMVTADRMSLEMILDNLVGNAIKYGKLGGHVWVVWHAEARRLSVKDDGVGIPASQLPMIWNRFYRVDDARSSAVKGNGLGLAIVRQLADGQGIGLGVESKEGVGTEFELAFAKTD